MLRERERAPPRLLPSEEDSLRLSRSPLSLPETFTRDEDERECLDDDVSEDADDAWGDAEDRRRDRVPEVGARSRPPDDDSLSDVTWLPDSYDM